MFILDFSINKIYKERENDESVVRHKREIIMRRLLLLGGSIAQIPFIKTAKRLGCYVGVVDYDDKAPAVEFADEYFNCSLLDVEGVFDAAKKFQPSGISCGASDVGVVTASIVCTKMGLPGMSKTVALTVKDKGMMIEAFRKNGVAHPEYQVIESINDDIKLSYPLIIKPVDNSGSRGINVAKNGNELIGALKDSFSCSRVHRVIVEEYLEGPEVSVELLIQNSKPYVLQVTDKITTGEPHFIEIGHSQPSQLNLQNIREIQELAYNAAKAVGIQDGCGHAEIKLTKSGPKMIEIAGRMGGDFISTVLLPTSTGINLAEYEILRAIGLPKDFSQELISNNNRGVAVKFIEAKSGMIQTVAIDYLGEEMVGVEEIKLVCKSGVKYGEAKNNNDRFGYVIATGKTTQIALDRCDKVLDRIKIEMDY